MRRLVIHPKGIAASRWPPLAAAGMILCLGALLPSPCAAKNAAPAGEIPLKGPYRYERGWYHKVEMGDSLPILANRFGVDLRYLARVNRASINARLKTNTYLYIPPHSGHYHRVRSGDTLSGVARKYHLDLQYLAATNRISPSTRLRTGEMLIIPTRKRPAPIPKQPAISAVYSSKSSTRTSKGSAGAAERASSSSGERKSAARAAVRSPKPGDTSSGRVTAAASGVSASSSKKVSRSSAISPPAGRPSSGAGDVRPAASRSSYQGSSGGSRTTRPTAVKRRPSDGRPAFRWPLEGTITRGYINRNDQKHRGVDIAAPAGTPIRAAADGDVIYSGGDVPGYGNMVLINHGRGWATCYAHNSENLVKKDARVAVGAVIAKVGKTGRATGNHLHFEIRRQYEAIDPLPLLP